MLLHNRSSRRRTIALAGVLLLSFVTGPAMAGGLFGETRFTDSFGNLIIHSPSGYKRIVVGQGDTSDRYIQSGFDKPKVAYLERRRGRILLREDEPYRYGALLKGRSYMYGLPDNVVPVPVVPCR